jgi:hypothetical protein
MRQLVIGLMAGLVFASIAGAQVCSNAVTLRAEKGSSLSWTEVDDNFENVRETCAWSLANLLLESVANIGALPACTAGDDGVIRVVLDTGSGVPGLYQCDGGATAWNVVAGGASFLAGLDYDDDGNFEVLSDGSTISIDPDDDTAPEFTFNGTSGGHLILPEEDDDATPTLAFGDGTTGFFADSFTTIKVSMAGTYQYVFGTAGFGAVSGGTTYPVLLAEVPSSTNPTVVPNGASDIDTGLGWNAANDLRGIANSVSVWGATDDGTDSKFSIFCRTTQTGNCQEWDVDGDTVAEVVITQNGEVFSTDQSGPSFGYSSAAGIGFPSTFAMDFTVNSSKNLRWAHVATGGSLGFPSKSDTTNHELFVHGTAGNGTDKAGANLYLWGGGSTGTGIGGDIIFETTPSGASGSGGNTRQTALTIDSETLNVEIATLIDLTPTDSPTSCGSTEEGQIYADDSENAPKYCDGSAWGALGGGSDTNAVREIVYSASSFDAIQHAADSIAPLLKDEGTNADVMVRAFDDTTDEAVGGNFVVPSDIDTSATVTFRLLFYAASAAANDACWDFSHKAITGSNNESWDQSMTIEPSGDCTADANQDETTVCTWTETVTNLGWAASETVFFELSRDADSSGGSCTSDNLSGDANLITFAVEVPRS